MEKRVLIYFGRHGFDKRLAIVDPRLVMPRRMSGHDAALGGLQALCFAIDTLLCPNAPQQAVNLAEQSILRGRAAVLAARREPESSDGPARDALVESSTFAALAREACGGLGLATSLSLALLNRAQRTLFSMDAPLRIVLVRVVVALAGELGVRDMENKSEGRRAATLVLGRSDASLCELSLYLLSLAEDVGVRLLGDLGITGTCAKPAALDVLNSALVSQCADFRLVEYESINRIACNAIEQQFEL